MPESPEIRLADVAMMDSASATGAWVTGLTVVAGPLQLAVVGADPSQRWDLPWSAVRSIAPGPAGRYANGLESASLTVELPDRSLLFVVPAAGMDPGAVAGMAALAARAHGPAAAAPAFGAPVQPAPYGAPAYGAPVQPVPYGAPAYGAGGAWPGPEEPTAPRSRRRTGLVVTVVVVLVVALVGGGIAVVAGSGPDTNLAGKTPSQVVATSNAAAKASGSFHYVERDSGTSGSSGSFSEVIIGDVGRTSGTQDITSGAQHFSIIVVGTGVYLRGNAQALTGQFGFSTSQGTTYAGKWISLAPGDGPTQNVAADVTLKDYWNDTTSLPGGGFPGAPAHVSGPTTQGGASVMTVQYTIHATSSTSSASVNGTATVSVAANAPNLPLAETIAATGTDGTGASQSERGTTAFSRWGEPVHPTAPSGAIPYASISPAPSGPSGPSGSGGGSVQT